MADSQTVSESPAENMTDGVKDTTNVTRPAAGAALVDTVTDQTPHVVLLDGKVYGFGQTRAQAEIAFQSQISGAPPNWQWSMTSRASTLPVSDDEASEIVEMIEAEALAWL